MEPDGELPHFEKRIFQEELNNINITEDMANKKLKKIKINHQDPINYIRVP